MSSVFFITIVFKLIVKQIYFEILVYKNVRENILFCRDILELIKENPAILLEMPEVQGNKQTNLHLAKQN
jgi:hypothetical protein